MSKKFRRGKGVDSTISTVKSYIFPAQLNAFLFLEVFGDQNHFLPGRPAPSNIILWFGRLAEIGVQNFKLKKVGDVLKGQLFTPRQRYSATHASVTNVELVIAAKTPVVKYQRNSFEMEHTNP